MIDDAIERFEKAEEGSRDLDRAFLEEVCTFKPNIDRVADWYLNGELVRFGGQYWNTNDGEMPSPSTNLQDAVNAIPEGCKWLVSTCENGGYAAVICRNGAVDGQVEIQAPTPELALCRGILKFMKAEQAADRVG